MAADGVAAGDLGVPVRRLTSTEDFRLAYREGRKHTSELAVVYVRRTGGRETRVGVTVGRQAGTAVRRNRLRRRIREALRQVGGLGAGADVVVMAKPGAHSASVAQLTAVLHDVLATAGLIET